MRLSDAFNLKLPHVCIEIGDHAGMCRLFFMISNVIIMLFCYPPLKLWNLQEEP